jgi:hypothetical protein
VYDEHDEPVPAGENRAGDGIDVWDAELIDDGPETGTTQPATAAADDGELVDAEIDDARTEDPATVADAEAAGRAEDTATATVREAEENADVWDTELIDDDPGAATTPRFVVVAGDTAADDHEDDIEDLVVVDHPAAADPEPTVGVPRRPAARVTAAAPAVRALRARYGRHARQHPRRRPVRVAVGAGGMTLLLLLAAVATIGADGGDGPGRSGNGSSGAPPDAGAAPGSGGDTSAVAADVRDRPGTGRDGQGSRPSAWVVVPDRQAASSDGRVTTGVGVTPPSVLPVLATTAPGPSAPSPTSAPVDATNAGQTVEVVVAAPHYDPAPPPPPAPAPPPPASAPPPPTPTYEIALPAQPTTSAPPTSW